MSWRRSLVAVALSATLIVAVVFGGGQWLASVLDGRLPVGSPTGDAPIEERAAAAARDAAQRAAEEAARRDAEAQVRAMSLEAWLAGALQRDLVAPHVTPESIDLVRAEHCGELYAVVFTERGDHPRDFFWVAGVPGADDSSQGGTTDEMDGSAIAAARATTSDPCVRLVDAKPVVSITNAVTVGAVAPDGVRLLGTTLLDPNLAVAVVEGNNADGNDQRWMGLVRLEDERWIVSPSSWIGTNIPANDGFTAYDLSTLDPALDNRELLVSALASDASTIELAVRGTVYRYDADRGAHGIVIPAPDMPIDGATFRVLDSHGGVIAEGSIRR